MAGLSHATFFPRLLATAVVVFALAGCFAISQYHLGYHTFSDGRMVYDVVSRDSVPDVEPFEEACIRDFANYRMEALKPRLAPRMNGAVDSGSLRRLNKKFRRDYGFNGTYERIRLVPRRTALERAALKNAFRYYDLVSSNYLLRGRFDAVVQLYMTKVNGELRLCGFEVVDFDSSRRKNRNDLVSYIYPESMKRDQGKNR